MNPEQIAPPTNHDQAAEDRMLAQALTDSGEPIAQFFTFAHLPERLANVSRSWCRLAAEIVLLLPRNPERTVALRKLLEGKDAAVRSYLFAPKEAP